MRLNLRRQSSADRDGAIDLPAVPPHNTATRTRPNAKVPTHLQTARDSICWTYSRNSISLAHHSGRREARCDTPSQAPSSNVAAPHRLRDPKAAERVSAGGLSHYQALCK